MLFVEQGGRRYARFERLAAETGLCHAFSMRPLDVSARQDERAAQRATNRERMALDLGIDPSRLHHTVQVHRTRLDVIRDAACGGRGFSPRAGDEAAPAANALIHEGADGLLTASVGIGLMTFSADCPLVLVHDGRRRAIGMVHSSWRCTVAGSTRLLVEALERELGCSPGDMKAGIGPSAGPCCYEVQADVYEAAKGLPGHDALFVRRGGRMYFDLWSASAQQLIAAGVPGDAIEVARVCTMCRGDQFFSFRREGAGCGHFGLMAALR